MTCRARSRIESNDSGMIRCTLCRGGEKMTDNVRGYSGACAKRTQGVGSLVPGTHTQYFSRTCPAMFVGAIAFLKHRLARQGACAPSAPNLNPRRSVSAPPEHITRTQVREHPAPAVSHRPERSLRRWRPAACLREIGHNDRRPSRKELSPGKSQHAASTRRVPGAKAPSAVEQLRRRLSPGRGAFT